MWWWKITTSSARCKALMHPDPRATPTCWRPRTRRRRWPSASITRWTSCLPDLRMPGMDGTVACVASPLGGFRGGMVLCSAPEDDVVDAVLRMQAGPMACRCWGASTSLPPISGIAQMIGAGAPAGARSQEEDGFQPPGRSVPRPGQDQLLPWYQPR